MSRYIDADLIVYSHSIARCKDGHNWNELVATKDEIDDLPTADVAEVVRCKECLYHEIEQIGMVYCPAVVGGWVEDNWFCAGGEKMDEVAE